MANAAVEKLKTFGIRHGEKVVVGFAVATFLALVAIPLTRGRVIDIDPDQLNKTAKDADSNLQKRQDAADILAKLEESGLKNPGLEKVVDAQQSKALNPDNYKVRSAWVSPEPGAGLIRDQPELIAVNDLYAFPGRGGLLMFELDAKGERIVDTGVDPNEAKKKSGRGSRRRSSMGGMMMSGGGGMPGMGGEGGFGGMSKKQQEEEAKRIAKANAERQKQLVGKVDTKKEAEAAKKQEELTGGAGGPQLPFKEKVVGKRWVVLTGTLDHKQMRDNWLEALKDPAVAHPNYLRLDVERQTRSADGTWSNWTGVNADKNYEVLDNLPELEEELTPEDVRLEALVDPLPFLKAGYWTGVHIARLVPKDKRKIEQPSGTAGMMGGAGGGYPGGMMDGGRGMMGGAGMMSGGAGGGYPGGMMAGGGGRGMMGPGGAGGEGMMMSGGSGMMMGGGGAGGQPQDDMSFTQSQADEVMIRSLDFTVDPESTYRFRVRVVVKNPNLGRTDVSPGTDTEATELAGPWSVVSNDVTVPADVATYVQSKLPPTNRRADSVKFQVVRWTPDDGNTLVRTDDAGPGQIVGEPMTTEVPSSDDGTKSKNVDYNSRSIVLDAIGGQQAIPSQLGLGSFPFEVPAIALVVRADGTVAVRNQADDLSDEVRRDMESNYKQALKDSGKKRAPGMGGYGGMMDGGMMGGMMGGMGGMGGGRR